MKQLQLEESYSEDYYDVLGAHSSHSIFRAYMATSYFVPSNLLSEVWIVDNNANQHILHKFEWFTSYKPLYFGQSGPITSVVGHKTYVVGIGTIRFLLHLPVWIEIYSLNDVLYVFGLDCNLLSITTMANKHDFIFTCSVDRCIFTKDNELYLIGRLRNDMYVLDLTDLLPSWLPYVIH